MAESKQTDTASLMLRNLVFFSADRPVWWRAVAMAVVVLPACVQFFGLPLFVAAFCTGLIVPIADDVLWPIYVRTRKTQ